MHLERKKLTCKQAYKVCTHAETGVSEVELPIHTHLSFYSYKNKKNNSDGPSGITDVTSLGIEIERERRFKASLASIAFPTTL